MVFSPLECAHLCYQTIECEGFSLERLTGSTNNRYKFSCSCLEEVNESKFMYDEESRIYNYLERY